MPPFEFFVDSESYYATLLHETVHWTSLPSRLSREFNRKRLGDEGYAMADDGPYAMSCSKRRLPPHVTIRS